MPAQEFEDDDQGYLSWVADHPEGLVVNCLKNRSGGYLVLHRATCRHIATPNRSNWTTNEYMKVCAPDEADLARWVARGNFSRTLTDPEARCGNCRPCL